MLDEGDDALESPPAGSVAEAVVVFAHAEAKDVEDRARVFRRALKNIKWLAGKRELRNVVLHSFAHLGGEKAEPEWTRELLRELAERLRSTGYEVSETPFGWFSAWQLDVYGESLAKVFQEF